MPNFDAMRMSPVQAPQEFAFTQGHMIDHPKYGTSVLWDNRFLCLVLPITSAQVRFDLAAFPRNTWVALQDESGSPIPVAICVDSRGVVMGKWLP